MVIKKFKESLRYFGSQAVYNHGSSVSQSTVPEEKVLCGSLQYFMIGTCLHSQENCQFRRTSGLVRFYLPLSSNDAANCSLLS